MCAIYFTFTVLSESRYVRLLGELRSDNDRETTSISLCFSAHIISKLELIKCNVNRVWVDVWCDMYWMVWLCCSVSVATLMVIDVTFYYFKKKNSAHNERVTGWCFFGVHFTCRATHFNPFLRTSGFRGLFSHNHCILMTQTNDLKTFFFWIKNCIFADRFGWFFCGKNRYPLTRGNFGSTHAIERVS